MNKNNTLLLSMLLFGFVFAPSSLYAQELTVEQATQEALQKNPSLQAAVSDRKRAQLAVEVEENRFRANVIAETKYSHQLNALGGASDSMLFTSELDRVLPMGTVLGASMTLDGTAQETIDNSYGLHFNLSVTQPLMQGFGAKLNKASLYTAQFNSAASEYSYDDTASALLRDVLGAYWELWYAQQAAAIQEQSLETIKAQVQEAMVRVEVGALAPSGALSLQTEEASVEEQLANAKADVLVRSLALSRLMGRTPTTTLIATSIAPAPAPLPSLSELTAHVEAGSYELKQLSASIDAAQVLARSAKDNRRPTLSAIGQLQLSSVSGQATSNADSLTNQTAGFLGLRLELPATKDVARAEEMRALLAVSAAEARFDAAQGSIAQQVSTQLEKINSEVLRVGLSQKTAALASATVEAERARFEAGVGTTFDLVRVQQQEREANLRVVRIQVDLLLDRLALSHLTGDLLLEAAS